MISVICVDGELVMSAFVIFCAIMSTNGRTL